MPMVPCSRCLLLLVFVHSNKSIERDLEAYYKYQYLFRVLMQMILLHCGVNVNRKILPILQSLVPF